MKNFLSSVKPVLPTLAMYAFATARAFAASTTVGGVDTSSGVNGFILLVQILAGMGVIALILHAFYELIKHRQVVMFLVEGVVGVVLGVIVYNGQTFAQNMGVGGAHI